MIKLFRNIFRALGILCVLVGLDIYSIYYRDKPIFVLEESIDNKNKIYYGILYDTYYCEDESKPQIKIKGSKFSCNIEDVTKTDNVEYKSKQAKLTLVGDLLFEQPFYDAINDGEDKNKYFNLVKDYFQNDDLSIGNMEVVIGNDKMVTSGVGYNFCAPLYIGDLVSTLDFEVLGTANNHAYDRSIEGINSTIEYFENTDIMTIGTYKSKEEREDLHILNINGIKFGFLAYTYGTNQKISEGNEALIGYYKDPNTKVWTDEYKNILKDEIRELKNASDIVVVLMHWGQEFNYNPNNEQKEMAKYLNELGVDIIVGSHSHNIQPIEIIGDKHQTLVYYSLGNFVSADDDIARTPLGQETFDNAYQVGMISTINVLLQDDKISYNNVETELVINYFDENMRNFELVPFTKYDENYELSHYRYSKGLTKDFIEDMYNNVIDERYRYDG